MSKLIPLDEAIAGFVNDGDMVYAAGFTHVHSPEEYRDDVGEAICTACRRE
jgi:acyl CoA:acetate/3-ketoacid CoA transferase alpha subunit